MRARSITVQGLFERFDYTIPLNLDERITIIHGPNGYGKTALLRLVEAMFNLRLDVLRSIPFALLRVDLDDDSYVAVRRSGQEREPLGLGLLAQLADVAERQRPREPVKHDVSLTYFIGKGQQEAISWEATADSEQLGGLKILSSLLVAAKKSGHPDSYLDIKLFVRKNLELNDTAWSVVRVLAGFPTRLVTIQRLLVPSKSSRKAHTDGGGEFESAIAFYSKQLCELVKATQARYTGVAQHLERTFPQRVMQRAPEEPGSDEALVDALVALEARRTRLIDLGILPSDGTGFQSPTGPFDDATRKLLRVYAGDIAEKLRVFDELAAKVGLLQAVINKRFQFKRLKIDMERGFLFVADDGRTLPPTALSSGEQHELVMLYECLFELAPDSLLLIDEPELSLHVSWQVEFLRDLQKIIELAHFDTLIATHSPQIINDRWDLTVDLHALLGAPDSRAADASQARLATAGSAE